MKFLTYAFLLISLLLSPQSFGTERDSNPPVIQRFFGDSPKVGQGTVYKFVVPAYDISLWSHPLPWTYGSLFALMVKVRWDATQQEMVDSTLEAMTRTEAAEGRPLSDETQREYKKILLSFYPNLQSKDTITVVYHPEKEIQFYHNNKLLKTVHDMAFAKAFCNIWLSPKTKFSSAREDLLNL